MNNHEFHIKNITEHFVTWQLRISHLNSLSLYDVNIFSENSIAELLHLVFGYEMKIISQLQRNYPAIDLGDKKNRIAAQVTATSSKAKIQSTLDKFFENELQKEYDKLIFIVLGDRMKKYDHLNVREGFDFNEASDVLGFKEMLKAINQLPLKELEKVSKLLDEGATKKAPIKMSDGARRIRSKLALKRKLQKELLLDLDKKNWEQAVYEPWIKFRYHNLIIRRVDDEKFPTVDEPDNDGMSSWFKGECWDFYENGLEFITHGGEAIFDDDGHWVELDWRGDARALNENYRVVPFNKFLRIPYEYIIEYDMELDDYYSSPSIFVEYAKDDMPYEEILFGKAGAYNPSQPHDSRHVYYFEKNKRKKLL